jgi:hypothetical protein
MSCHKDPAAIEGWATGQHALVARAKLLLSELDKACDNTQPAAIAAPPHARAQGKACASQALARARYAAQLVSEDGAAYVHNAPFARQLLDEAAAALAATLPGSLGHP